jgi:hypothetical protein
LLKTGDKMSALVWWRKYCKKNHEMPSAIEGYNAGFNAGMERAAKIADNGTGSSQYDKDISTLIAMAIRKEISND